MQNSLTDGAAVRCGICGRETTILFIVDRIGGKSFDLACRHRNALCPNCGDLVRDDSDRLESVMPLCRRCNPEAFAEEDDI